MSGKLRITARERLKIAVLSDTSDSTVDRCYLGKRVHATSHARITRSAQEIGAELPPPMLPASSAHQTA